MKKLIYIITLTLCFVLALIGKSYGQGIHIIDQDSFSVVLNSIKKGDFFYSVETQSNNKGLITYYTPFPQSYEKTAIIFTKRNLSGLLLKKIEIGKYSFFENWSLTYNGNVYYYYSIIPRPNNEFTVAFVNDSLLPGIAATPAKQFLKICEIKENANFSANTIYYDTLIHHPENYTYKVNYKPRTVKLTGDNNYIFTKTDYNASDSNYIAKLLKIDLHGNVVHLDTLYKSKTNYEVFTFVNADTIIALYYTDSAQIPKYCNIIKYNNNLQRILFVKLNRANVQPSINSFYLGNNDINTIAIKSSNDSMYIHSILDNSNSDKIAYNQFQRYYSFEPYMEIEKLVSDDNKIIDYPIYGGSYNSNKVDYFNTNPFSKKFSNEVLPFTFKFAYRGILRDATAYITTYASEKEDSCIYVFGEIRFMDSTYIVPFSGIAFYKNLLFLKKVCNGNSDYNIDNFIIKGNVFADFNNNCLKDSAENRLKNFTCTDDYNGQINFTSSDINGNYSFYYNSADTGWHYIKLRELVDYPYYDRDSCSVQSIYAPSRADTLRANLAMKTDYACMYNVVHISAPTRFRSGMPQTYSVNYCNNGTILSPNTYITIKLDSLLDFNSASIAYTTLPNYTYRFNIGDLNFLDCGSFTFIATPRPNAVIRGQTLCVEAHIYPDSICTTPNYTGSYIVASAQCLGDSVELKLENRGGNMQQIKKYIVIEDQVMRINRNYQLPRNGTIIEKMPADSGHTYRIIAEQEDALPPSYGDKFATAAIEGCRPNPALNFSTGYFTQFPNYDGEPFRAVSCNVITGAYDPNDKVASPVGYAAQHYIEKNTQIDYQINFQNTGNDTAFKVVVVDTIAPTLDINSILLGVASHTYQFQRTDSNVVQFVFDNILLVDSFRNEPKSHGFVKFKIQQKLNNPNGTKIYNSAGIYFDYNAPIITNRTFHTVGQNFVTVQLINTIKNSKYNVKEVKVFPNPFRDKTQIIVESNELKNPVLLLMNIQGQLIKTISSTNNTTFDIYRDDLSNGMYLFKIMQSDETVANGKVVVQ